MKQLKRLFLALLCGGTIMGTAACGSNNNADDNGATQDGTTNGTADDAGNTNGTDDANGTNDDTKEKAKKAKFQLQIYYIIVMFIWQL